MPAVTSRRIGIAAAGVLLVAAAVLVLRDPGDSAGPTAEKPVSTAEITRQTLVDRESHDGTLGYGGSATVSARVGGTITALPREGVTISRGQAAYRLDDTPVTVLYGTLPAYRTLKAGLTGADVMQFEQNLWALGYRGFTPDTRYNWATTAAVEDWQADLGVTATGAVEPDRIVYTDGTVRVDSLSVQPGTVVGPGTEVEKVTGTSPLILVVLDAVSGRLARPDAEVQVKLPDGKVVPGRVLTVKTVVAGAGNGQSQTTTFQVTIGFAAMVDTWGAAAVRVAFTVGQRPDVLTVPVAALVALAEGRYGIELVDGDTTRLVAVETGLFADGRVEISAPGLEPGATVVMPS